MSDAQRMLLQAITATQRVTRAAMELAAEVRLEPGLDEEEEAEEEEEDLMPGEEDLARGGSEHAEKSNPGHLRPPNKSDVSTASQPSE